MVDQFSRAVTGVNARRLEPEAVIALVDASPDGVMVIDADGVVRFANLAAAGIFSRRGDRLVGSEFGIPIVSLDKVDIDVPLESGGIGVFELRITDASWSGADAKLVTVRDVTERARHEAQVRQLNRELRLRADAAMVLTHVGDGVVLLDHGGVVLMWNPAAGRILGLPRSEAIGRTMTTLVPGWQHVVSEVPLVIAHAGAQPTGRSVVVDVHGEERWLSITGVQFDGGTVYAFHDLTEEVRVATLKRDFIDTASHELRTPLTAIYGAAHTLRRDDLDLSASVQGELVDVIWTQSQRLQRITENILATRKLDHDATDVQVTRFDAVQLADDIVSVARSHAPAHVQLEVLDQLEGDNAMVADEGKLRQILGNLVQNAVKYSPDGGSVTVRVRHARASIEYQVTDEGLGIGAGDLERIFEKFYRSSAHEGRSIEGTGLGLYIARELARRLGGELHATSCRGDGSTFTLRVPRPPDE